MTVTESQQLAEENMALVPFMVNRVWETVPAMRHAFDSKEDAIALGYLVLARCAKKYDRSKGIKFSTYACSSIGRELFRWANRKKTPSMADDTVLEFSASDAGSECRRLRDHHVVRDAVTKMIAVLSPEEAIVVEKVFGINTEPVPITVLASVMGMKSSRVRYILEQAMKRMRFHTQFIRTEQ